MAKNRVYEGHALVAASRYCEYLPTRPQAEQDRVSSRIDE